MFRPMEWFRRLRYLMNRRRYDQALADEMAAHREMLADPTTFGNTQRLREEARDTWGWRWLDDITRDGRVAVGFLARSPGFAATAIGSLALGFVLLATTAAVVNAYLLRPLPYGGAPERLFHVRYAPPGPWEPAGLSAMNWDDVRDVVQFPVTAASETYYLTEGTYAQAARGLRAGRGFIEGLAVDAAVGRALDAGDYRAADAVAMIGHDLWRTRYASDPEIVGRIVRLETESAAGAASTVRVVGVLQPDFYFGRDSSAVVDILRPLTTPSRTYLVRLQPGVPVEVAERRLTEAARVVSTDLPTDWTGVHLESARERYVGQLRPVLTGAAGIAVLVLALVCTNVAILTLMRAIRRDKEMAVRLALGSGRWRLVRMLAIEASIIAGAATLAGIVLATAMLRVLAPIIQTRLGRPAPGGPGALTLDPSVLIAVGAAGALVALALTLLPALLLRQPTIGAVLRRDRSASTDSVRTRSLRAALLALQVAGTVVLLVGGGLLGQTTLRMIRTDLGFPTDGLYRSRITLRAADYDDASFSRFYDQFAASGSERLGTAIVFSTWPPYADLPIVQVETDGPIGRGTPAGSLRVSGAYLTTLGIRLLEGRDITDADQRGGADVAIVSATLASRLHPAGHVLGRRIRPVEVTGGGSTPGPWLTIVGVAADVRQDYVDMDVADLYRPLPRARDRFASFYVRSGLGLSDLWSQLRSVAASVDSHAVVAEPRSVSSENQALESARFLTAAFAGIAAASVLLAALGIYAVTAFSVQQQSRDTALRIALGATSGQIRRRFLQHLGGTLGAGVVVGVAVAAGASRLMAGVLYGVPPLHVPTILLASAFVVGIGLLAAWRPVRRASHQHPAVVLKEL